MKSFIINFIFPQDTPFFYTRKNSRRSFERTDRNGWGEKNHQLGSESFGTDDMASKDGKQIRPVSGSSTITVGIVGVIGVVLLVVVSVGVYKYKKTKHSDRLLSGENVASYTAI